MFLVVVKTWGNLFKSTYKVNETLKFGDLGIVNLFIFEGNNCFFYLVNKGLFRHEIKSSM